MPADNDTLSAVGDLCGPVVLNQIGAPDAAARWTLTGPYAGVAGVFEKATTKADYDAGTWSPLASVVRQDTFNVLANGAVAGLTNLTLDFVAPSLFGLYAVRFRLTAIASGAVAAQVVTTARALTDPSAFMATMALELTRIRFGIGLLTDTDLSAIPDTGSA